MTDALGRAAPLGSVRRRLPRVDGLAMRVAMFLTLAVLPLGLIALDQARGYRQESEGRARQSLLAFTDHAGADVQQAVERALGAAEALAVIPDLLSDPATCSIILRRFIAEPAPYAFAGIASSNGSVRCSSASDPFDLGRDVAALVGSGTPRVRVQIAPAGLVSGEEALVVAMPVPEVTLPAGDDAPGTDAGLLMLSIPRERLMPPTPIAPEDRPLSLLTFNADGDVLTVQSANGLGAASPAGLAGQSPSSSDPAAAGAARFMDLLPEGTTLTQAATGEARAVEAEDSDGEPHLYTIVPLVPGVVYAMAIWHPRQGLDGVAVPSLLLPALMWVTALVVAYWALDGLVIRPVADLRASMRRFGSGRTLDPDPPARHAVAELRGIGEAYQEMARSILQDEASMENAYRERGVLLREVHHRVKNNLQLISSIISMQVRRASDARTRMILRRLQDRVLTLAAIYRTLYTSADIGDVNVAPILEAIVAQELAARQGRPGASLDLKDVVLDPDKVVPLAFLAAEAVSNAATFAVPSGDEPAIAVSLRQNGTATTFRVDNLRASPPPSQVGDAAGRAGEPGLGRHLMDAFAAQLGATVIVNQDTGRYHISVTFDADPGSRDGTPVTHDAHPSAEGLSMAAREA